MSYKFRITSVVTEPSGSSLKGIYASFEVRDSNGSGIIAVDSANMTQLEGFEPIYADSAALQARTQTQLFNDFYRNDSIGAEILVVIGEILQTKVEAEVEEQQPVHRTIEDITDQNSITIVP